MSEPREFVFVPLKRAARYLVGKPKAALRYRRQNHVDRSTVFVDSDFAGDPGSRKSTTGPVAQIGNHTVKSGSTLQSLTALSVGGAEFYAVVKGGQVGLSLRSKNQDLGILMKLEIQSDSSTANSLKDRLGAGQRTKHIDTRYFWIQERIQDGDLSIKKVPTAKNFADVRTKPVSASVLQQHCKFAGLWCCTDHGCHTHYKMTVTSRWWIWWRWCRPDIDPTWSRKHEHRNRQLPAFIVNIETDVHAEWNEWTVDEFGHCSRWTDPDSNCKKQINGNMQREILWTLTDAELGENF